MKVVTSIQMSQLESLAYRDGSSEEDFMEQAGKGIAREIHRFCENRKLVKHIVLLCGRGNNAGDAFVAGRYLRAQGYEVFAFLIDSLKDCSPLTQKNHSLFLSKGGVAHEVNQVEEIILPPEGVIIDGIFGTGFHGVAKEPYASVIKRANRSKLPIISIDIPSGINGNTGVVEGPVIKATETIFLGLPKVGFFLHDGWNVVGRLQHVDFGLPHSYIKEFKADLLLLSEGMMRPLLPPVQNNRHKYQAGFVVGLGGSPGMPGAPIMTSLASLRGGAGIVKLLHPKEMEEEFVAAPLELVRIPINRKDHPEVLKWLNSASAIFLGPGIGTEGETSELIQYLLPKINRPAVIDADALNIIAEERLDPPKNSILTPHLGELSRLLRIKKLQPGTPELLKKCQTYCEEHQITLILKGGCTFIFHPDETPRVNANGDPGMATAGSGDVLTGLIAALLAQGLAPHKAASLGVYLHGLAGSHAAAAKTSYGMIATDIIDHFPEAFRFKNHVFSGKNV